jgi:hypothetical protein
MKYGAPARRTHVRVIQTRLIVCAKRIRRSANLIYSIVVFRVDALAVMRSTHFSHLVVRLR